MINMDITTARSIESNYLKYSAILKKNDKINMDITTARSIESNYLKYSAILKKNHPSIDYNITSFPGASF